ncbi:MAG: 50S ribosomal protein L20 [Rickettsiales bacterium]|jgi:large subunit ribosomal protein L20|nr:50S ribosomal protein L20 [Rickettsiales bacterium]
MARVKRGIQTKKTHKKVLDKAKGYRGRHHTTLRAAREKVEKAGQYAYRDRKAKKREFRSLWIIRINAAVREAGMSYSQFMNALKGMNVGLDRKVLAEMAYDNDAAFKTLIENAKRFISAKTK